MELEPIIDPVVDVIGEYAKDSGQSLIRAGAERALEALKSLYNKVMGRVEEDDPKTAERFPADPDGYRVPLKDTLTEAARKDPDFAEALRDLLAEYREAASAAGITTQTATVIGDGAVVQGQGSAGAGAGGVAVVGNVGAGVSTGKKDE